jgi:dTDP-glucose 4,6-dehydratase
VLEVTELKSKLRFESLPPDDPARRRADIAKARNLLGWEPRVGLKQGLERSLEFFGSMLESCFTDLRM